MPWKQRYTRNIVGAPLQIWQRAIWNRVQLHKTSRTICAKRSRCGDIQASGYKERGNCCEQRHINLDVEVNKIPTESTDYWLN